MTPDAWHLVAVPLGLGLFGFVEPCSLGATLLFVKFLEGKSRARKLVETALFAGTRGLFIGLLGLAATALGSVFLELQRMGWVALGALIAALGLLHATGAWRPLAMRLGPRLPSGGGTAAGLGLLFGLNVPACAAPLLAALLGAAAVGGAGGWSPLAGFVALAVFGLSLSLPLLAVVLWPGAHRLLDRLGDLARRFPLVAGLLLVVLGLWSVLFGLFATLPEA